MRNKRGALTALLLAGAAYAWNNRDRLSQQLRSFRGRRDDSSQSGSRYALPDLQEREIREFDVPARGDSEREFGGTRM